MSVNRYYKTVVAASASAAVVLVALAISSPQGRADDPNSDEAKIQQGFAIAPVPLNLSGRNRALVGMGSYLVNAVGDCNGCHSQGPATAFATGGNPYLLPPVFSGKKKVNPATYLGGGNDFGPLIPDSAHIVSRNLTPDKNGRPEGGNSFSQFLQILRTGVDMDQLHPTCHGNTVGPNCVPFPFNGALLQIMPWPNFQNMTDNDIRAIYEYLSAIPCIDTVITGELQLRNTCK